MSYENIDIRIKVVKLGVIPGAGGKLMDEALGAERQIADFVQIAVMAAKESVDRGFESGLSGGVVSECRLFYALFATADQKEGMEAFLIQQEPQFNG